MCACVSKHNLCVLVQPKPSIIAFFVNQASILILFLKTESQIAILCTTITIHNFTKSCSTTCKTILSHSCERSTANDKGVKREESDSMQSHSLLDTKSGLISPKKKNGTNNSKCNVCSTVILQKGVNTSNMLKHLSGWTTTDHLSVRVWCSKTKTLFCWDWKAIRPTFCHTENPQKSIRQSLNINENRDSHP